ncbi:hypothetical protein KIPE111705_38530 [Kibdelosporangium persicum]|uniref:Uncharacterized protein n=1 Tax=Kibdelosporangium persicum TaxID=2698649 RepID=A0ABX2F7G8_9PSEU|nr:hypothetical protein [Kibdelosporangium persicum]NRN66763.1 hypothetical protein [Kibdelosporangium persicum]
MDSTRGTGTDLPLTRGGTICQTTGYYYPNNQVHAEECVRAGTPFGGDPSWVWHLVRACDCHPPIDQ